MVLIFGMGIASERIYQHYWVNNVGELRLKRTDPEIQLTIDGTSFTDWHEPVTLRAGAHRFIATSGTLQLETTFHVKRGDKALYQNVVAYQLAHGQLRVTRDSQLAGAVPKPDPEICEIRTASGSHWFMTGAGKIGLRDPLNQDGLELFTVHWLDRDLRKAFIQGRDGRYVAHRTNTQEIPLGYLAACDEDELPSVFELNAVTDKPSWMTVAHRKHFVDSRMDPMQPRTTQYDIHASPHCLVRVADQQDRVAARPPKPAVQMANNSRSVRRFKGHTGAINGALFTPDGKHLITGSSDGTIRFWNVSTGSQVGEIQAHRPVLSIAISRDGKRLAGGLTDAVVKSWDLKHASVLSYENQHIWSRDSRGDVLSIAFSPDGTKLAAGGNKQQHTRVWDLLNPGQRCKSSSLVGTVTSMAWTSSGETLLGCVDTRNLYHWPIIAERSFIRYQIKNSLSIHSATGTLLLQPMDVPYALLLGEIIDAENDHLVYSYQKRDGLQPVSAQLSLNGRILVTADVIVSKIEMHEREPDELVTVWDLATGQPQAVMRDRFGQVGNIAISPNGKYIAYGSGKRKTNTLYEVKSTGDYDLRVWDISAE